MEKKSAFVVDDVDVDVDVVVDVVVRRTGALVGSEVVAVSGTPGWKCNIDRLSTFCDLPSTAPVWGWMGG